MPSMPTPSSFPTFPRSATNPANARRRRLARAVAVAVEALEHRQLMSVALVSANLAASGGGNGVSVESSVSADGRYVAFRSEANNLIAGDANGTSDIFLRDRVAGTTVLVSANAAGAPANGYSGEPAVSADGRFVAFRSSATDIVAGDNNAKDDIFLRDLMFGTTTLVSRAMGSTGPGNEFSAEPTISADGRYVAFTSRASNLVGNDFNTRIDAFLRDTVTGTTELLSVNHEGISSGNERSFDPSVNADGRYVTFRSAASDLVATGDANGNTLDVFVRDRMTGMTRLVSVNPAGASANGESTSNSISADGRFVAFRSAATDLVSNDANGRDDVFLRDTQLNTTTLLSVNRLRTGSGNGTSGEPSVSSDGRYAAFSSTASDLVAGDTNAKSDIFLIDLQTGAVTLLSMNVVNTGPADGDSTDPYVSTDGRFVAFTSASGNLVSGDANGQPDVFVASAPTPEEDPAPPQAEVPPAQPPAEPGATTYEFNVTYTDDVAINVNSLGDDDVLVTGPGGQNVPVRFVRYVGSGMSVVATYAFDAPGGTLDPLDSGAYAITLVPGAVTDAAGKPLGTPPESAPPPVVVIDIPPPDGPDLVGSFATSLPMSVLGGAKGKVSVRVRNAGNRDLTTPTNVNVRLVASTDMTVDAGDVQAGTATLKKLKLKIDKSKTVKISNFKFPANVSDGPYFILAVVDSSSALAERNEVNNTAVSSGTVTIARPFVDLTIAAGGITGLRGPLVAGKKVTATVTITNLGNVDAKRSVPVALFASADGAVGDDLALGTVTAKVSLKPGRSKVFKLKFTVPAGLTAASGYRLAAIVDPANALSEPNESNNSSVGGGTFAIA